MQILTLNSLLLIQKEVEFSSSSWIFLAHELRRKSFFLSVFGLFPSTNCVGRVFFFQFLDFSRARIASAATDLLAFIHSAGDSTAREDFLIRYHSLIWRGKFSSEVLEPKLIILYNRFVYYETLVTSMKSLGVREPVISYDDLKVAEYHG